MKSNKVLAFLMLLALLAFTLAGCNGAPAPEEATSAPAESTSAPAEETAAPIAVVVTIGADPADLSPFTGNNLGRIAVLKTIYEYLLEADSMGSEAVPMLAKEVTKVDDLTYDVTIFDYITDSAGNHITAADVAWSYTTAIEGGQMRPLGSVESVTQTGDYTARFVLKAAPGVGDVDKILTEAPIISQKAYEESPDKMATKPITTSPYVLTEFVPGSSLSFEKRADYWQTDPEYRTIFSQTNVDKITFQVITEPAQNAIALETGTADISAAVSGDDISRFEGNPDYTVFKFKDNLTWMLAFNGTEGSPFFDNKDLRQAIAYAIDTTAMCTAVGSCAPAHTLGNSNFGGYQEKWDSEPYYEFDLTKAKELFAASGHQPGDLTVKLLVSNSPKDGLVAQIVQAALAEIGITVNIDAEETSVYNQAMYDPTAFDMALVAAAGGDFAISPWLLEYDQNRNNGTTGQFFKDDQLQSLLMTASSLAGYTPENVDAFNQYQKEQVYVYAMYSWVNNVVAVKGVTDIVRDTRGQIIPGACVYSSDYK